jgi:hypothetical protein
MLESKITRRAKFLAEMEAVIPRRRLLAVIEPHYPKPEQGRPPHPLRACCASTSCGNASTGPTRPWKTRLYDSESMRRFAGIELTADLVPDETPILRFRHLFEKHRLTEAVFAEVRHALQRARVSHPERHRRGEPGSSRHRHRHEHSGRTSHCIPGHRS